MTELQRYIGTKIIQARPMKLGAYNEHRGWTIPADEDRERDGFLVVYEDGYMSWSPAEAFRAYRPCGAMNFGLAIEAMKTGKKLARAGWNGKDMYVVYQPGYPEGIPINRNTAIATGVPEGNVCYFRPYLMMKTVNLHEFVPWLASQTDMLADDWMIIE
jgi:hypothetical protein